jgi:isoleucyl-tRNA synthetase
LELPLFDKPAFSNVIVNGLILAEDGQKMSKRKKNYPDPKIIFDKYGADALRLFLLGSPVVRGEDLKFSENSIKEVLRGVMIPMWNAYSFFVTYANLDKWTPPATLTAPENPENPLDRWILSSLSEMVEEIRDNMDNYILQKAANRFEKFVEDLTNWYIRRSRRRFWKSQNDTDKDDAYATLYYVLVTFCKTAAPFIPFITEEIYSNLRTESMPESVHLCDFPEPDKESRNPRLERQMEYTMATVTQGRFLRAQHSLKVRQPLNKVIIASPDEETRTLLKETADIIAEELNVKNVEIDSDESKLVTRSVKANYKVLGSKLGKNMKEVAGMIMNLDTPQVELILNGDNVTLTLASGEELQISQDDVLVQRAEKPGLCVSTEKEITVALDTILTEELQCEGMARELVSRIQNLRKETGFEVSDRIDILYKVENSGLEKAIAQFKDYICSETLANQLTAASDINEMTDAEIDGVKILLSLKKI